MTSAYSRPDLQKIQSAARSEAVFNVNQASLGATHQVCPTRNNCSLKDSIETPTLIHLHCLSLLAFHSDGMSFLAGNAGKKNLFLNGLTYRSNGCGPEIVDAHS